MKSPTLKGTKSIISFAALQQDPRFSFMRDYKKDNGNSNEIFSKIKKVDIETLSVSQLQEVP